MASKSVERFSGLQIGGRYGRIGVEIVDHIGSVAVVNRVASKRLDYLDTVRSQAARNGDPAYQAENEAQQLEGELEATIRLAHVMAAAPDLLAAATHALEILNTLTSEQFARGEDKSARDALTAAIARAEGK